MSNDRTKPPFWRRGEPTPRCDIALLRSKFLPKGKRFETIKDVRRESGRSARLLISSKVGSVALAKRLDRCRKGPDRCNQPFCPVCARTFRLWFVGELLSVTEDESSSYVFTILLAVADYDKIRQLDPAGFRHMLRKRLLRAGLNVPAIGGFEVVYKARDRIWLLHIHLVVIGGSKPALEEFQQSWKDSEIERATLGAPLKDRAEQLSYLLKFVTYHRPYKQKGSSKSKARPLNGREHAAALVKWMAQFEFQDFLLLVNARREGGSKIMLQGQAND